MEIKVCKEKDIVEVGMFYDRVVSYLCETINYPKWQYKKYPSEISVREKVKVQQQFVCVDGESIVGAFVLNDDPEGKYENADWTAKILQGEYMVCHTLATDPEVQGKGIKGLWHSSATDPFMYLIRFFNKNIQNHCYHS